MSDSTNKKVSILFSDLRGFAGIFERCQPHDVIDMLNRYFAQMSEIIAQYEGRVDKYSGDSIMAVFGLDEPHEDDLLRAVACAVEMQLAMDDVNRINVEYAMPTMHIGIGIHSGIVTSCLLGPHQHNEFTLIGKEVALASRIKAQALRGQILISEAAYEEVRTSVEVGQPIQIQVKGNEKAFTLYELVSTQWPLSMDVPRREGRQSPRIEMDEPFRFQVVQGETLMPEIHRGRIKDLSYQGMFALIPHIHPVPTDIRLELALSMFSGETRSIHGKIQAAREVGDHIGCGVEFSNLDQDSQKALKHSIDRILDGY